MSVFGDYVAAYDITGNKERSKAARILQDFGSRVQKSVFELRLRKGDLEKLQARLTQANIYSGKVSLYRLAGASKILEISGDKVQPKEETAAWII